MGLQSTFGLQPVSELIVEIQNLRTANKHLQRQLYDQYNNGICQIDEHQHFSKLKIKAENSDILITQLQNSCQTYQAQIDEKNEQITSLNK